MYKSPITKIHRQLANQINVQLEGEVVKAVMECNIDVNKDELIKALKYDREQYQKGYEDGKDTNVPSKWIPASERLPEDSEPVLVSLAWESIDIGWYHHKSGEWCSEYCTYDPDYGVEAWMPLPEPYKEGGIDG